MRTIIITRGFRRPQTRTQQVIEFVVRWLITAFAVWVAAQLVDGIHLDGFWTTLFVALILGLLNAIAKPILVFGTFPLLIMTLGLFLIVINALLLGLTSWIADLLDLSFEVDGFWSAVFGAIIISVVSFVLNRLIEPGNLARRVGS